MEDVFLNIFILQDFLFLLPPYTTLSGYNIKNNEHINHTIQHFKVRGAFLKIVVSVIKRTLDFKKLWYMNLYYFHVP